jgi:hypothetical protein
MAGRVVASSPSHDPRATESTFLVGNFELKDWCGWKLRRHEYLWGVKVEFVARVLFAA